MKAFFSYAHADGELVEAVVNKLARPLVNVDSISFRAADELISAMEKAIRDSAIFVLFASKPALESAWVNFELNEARYHQALMRIKKLLVVVLDDRITIHEFPSWMRRNLFLHSRSPAPIARAIRRLVDELVQEVQSSYFVGRSNETADLQAAFVPPDGSINTSIVTVRGLPGIGRRSLLRRVVRDSLPIDTLLTIRVQPGDTVNSLAIKLADLVEPAVVPEDTLKIASEIESLSDRDAVKRFLADLTNAMKIREMVVFYDEGGLLDNDGHLSPSLTLLFNELKRNDHLNVALVTNRRPSMADTSELAGVPIVDVGPLSLNESKQLIAFISKDKGIQIPLGDMGPLAEQVHGYPPDARALVEFVQAYGVPAAANVARRSAQYQPRPLTRYLRSLYLDENEQKILVVLARNSPLPVEVISAFAENSSKAVEALISLIDKSLISPQEGTSWYRISDPIIQYVIRNLPPCTIQDYSTVARELEQFLSGDSNSGQYLDLSRVFYRALTHAGKEHLPRAYALMADLLKLAEDMYHQRDYGKALEIATSAYETTPSPEALSWKIKCNTKLAEYSVALELIEELRRLGQVREAHFLRGFLERSRGHYSDAVKYYELARKAGRGGLALERDLAECYFHTGDLERATYHVEAAQRRQSDNRYVLSLRVKIACRQRNEAAARALLPLIDEVDSRLFAQHRHSIVEATFGNISKAYTHASQAASESARPPREVLANLAYCEIRTGRYEDASKSLNRLEALYPKQRRDVLLSLRARLALIEKRFEDSLGYCESLENKTAPEYYELKRDALIGLLAHKSMSSTEKAEMELMLEELESQINSNAPESEWSPGAE